MTVPKAKSKNITDLPNEVLCQIMSHLSTSDILCGVAPTSKQFYQISLCPYTHLVVTVNSHAPLDFLRIANRMTSLCITEDVTQGLDDLFRIISKYEHLEVFHFHGNEGMSINVFADLESSSWWNSLRDFKFGIDFHSLHCALNCLSKKCKTNVIETNVIETNLIETQDKLILPTAESS